MKNSKFWPALKKIESNIRKYSLQTKEDKDYVENYIKGIGGDIQ